MKTDSVLYWVIYFIVTVLVAWIAFSLILMWFKPALYNANGTVNWWVTLWVAALIILFAWVMMVLLWLVMGLFREVGCHSGCDVKQDPCDKHHHDPRLWMH